jgi:hypothetical protein
MTKIVTRIAITYKPQALVVEFKKAEDDNNIFHKKISFRKIDEGMDHERLASLLIEKYPELFETVPRNTIEKMLKRLLDWKDDPRTFALNPEESTETDLNKVSDEELIEVKKTMDDVYSSNRISPSDQRYEYDRRVDYFPESDSSWD